MALTDFFKRRRAGRPPQEPQRDTKPYPQLYQLGTGVRVSDRRSLPKLTPRNLRYFAKTPIARRAINSIKNPVAMLDWEVVPLKGVTETPELARQIEVVTNCLAHPNHDDSFRSLVEQVIEDILCGGGAIEQQVGGDPIRPLWLWPVDGLTIQVYPGWTGAPNEARYAQSIGFGTYSGSNQTIDLRNDEIIYIRPNPTTASPFGVGPLEIAFDWVSRFLSVGEYTGNLASNQRPSIVIDLGDVTEEEVQTFRGYWQNEVEGQGRVPIVGFPGAPGDKASRGIGINRLYPEGDDGMYLKYQEFLIRVIATAFDISPQNLSVEADVNRNTAEVSEDRDWDAAIKPMAHLLAEHLTREAIHGLLGFSQLRFRFVGLDREDEQATAKVYETYFRSNLLTPNEQRERLGLPPMEGQWGDMTYADVQVAIAAARGAKVVEDAALEKDGDDGATPAQEPGDDPGNQPGTGRKPGAGRRKGAGNAPQQRARR